MTVPGNLKTVFEYHDRTKHHLDRYARSLGYMDWNTQPDPFRRYEGAPLLRLEIPAEDPYPTYDSLFAAPTPSMPPPVTPPLAAPTPSGPLTRESLSRLFYYSLSLSAWKQVRGLGGEIQNRWPLRVDPSSGNLHPTEGYLICGRVEGLCGKPAVYHYAPREHGLELRRELDGIPGLPAGSALIGITSIHWREAWKYGERAFRYCQHDCGHVIAAVTLAAACLGWRAKLIDSIPTRQLSRMLGVDTQEGPEAEHAGCLLLLSPHPAAYEPAELLGSAWQGTPNQLSSSHHPWPVIDEISAAAGNFGFPGSAPDPPAAPESPEPSLPARGITTSLHHATPPIGEVSAAANPPAAPQPPERNLPAHRIIRQRRSAVSMDGKTTMPRDTFYRMLARLMPQPVPYGALAWPPAVSLLLFVNRVDDFSQGLYVLVRDPSHEKSLRDALRDAFLWERPATCPAGLPLYLLVPSGVKDAARTLSCHQDIAADGVFAVGMLARFEETLRAAGPAMYPRLFWETGVIGQVLYLEAEAAGIQGTGIGCFFDDAVHQTIGIEDYSWQSLYHFTVGGPVDDPRLETEAAYNHL